MASQINVMLACFSSLLLKCMKHINRIVKLSDIDYSPLTQNADADFVHACSDYLHRFPIAWFESGKFRRSSRLDPAKFSGFIVIVNII